MTEIISCDIFQKDLYEEIKNSKFHAILADKVKSHND